MLGAAGPDPRQCCQHNNHWGVPLSLARMPEAATYGVFELGMNTPVRSGP